MAIKKVFNIKNSKARTCLKCNKQIKKVLRDNEIYTCSACGQKHFVDILEAEVVHLTVVEREEIRRRIKQEDKE